MGDRVNDAIGAARSLSDDEKRRFWQQLVGLPEFQAILSDHDQAVQAAAASVVEAIANGFSVRAFHDGTTHPKLLGLADELWDARVALEAHRKYDCTIVALVTHLHENRGMRFGGAMKAVIEDFGLRRPDGKPYKAEDLRSQYRRYANEWQKATWTAHAGVREDVGAFISQEPEPATNPDTSTVQK